MGFYMLMAGMPERDVSGELNRSLGRIAALIFYNDLNFSNPGYYFAHIGALVHKSENHI